MYGVDRNRLRGCGATPDEAGHDVRGVVVQGGEDNDWWGRFGGVTF